MLNTINQVTYLEVYFSKNRIFTMKACIIIRLHNQLRNKRKQARAELVQAQGTQSSYPFVCIRWLGDWNCPIGCQVGG